MSGYAPAAKRVTEISSAGMILFDGELRGNFIFFVRANDPKRHFWILSKALYAYKIKQKGGSDDMIHSPEELQQLIHDDGVRFIVVSDQAPLHFESQKMLRNLVKDPTFRELGRFPIRGDNLPFPAPNCSLVVYENMAWTPPVNKFLRIKMLTLDHDIIVPMDN